MKLIGNIIPIVLAFIVALAVTSSVDIPAILKINNVVAGAICLVSALILYIALKKVKIL